MEVEVEADGLEDEALDADEVRTMCLLSLRNKFRGLGSDVRKRSEGRGRTWGSPSPTPVPPSRRFWTCQAAIWISLSFLRVSSSLLATRRHARDTSWCGKSTREKWRWKRWYSFCAVAIVLRGLWGDWVLAFSRVGGVNSPRRAF